MGACRTIDPARQARRQQAPCRGARSDERDHVYFEHGMPVACDPERPAAAQHTFRLSRLVELRRELLEKHTGLLAAGKHVEELEEQQRSVMEPVVETRATTLEGFAFKARLAAADYVLSDEVAESIIDDLLAARVEN